MTSQHKHTRPHRQRQHHVLPREFYLRDDVTLIARELLGKVLVTRCRGALTAGQIVETEAYRGIDDRACHANNGRRTKRNEAMYGAGGHAYVYLCYGLHHLFNVVTNVSGRADAVLIRAIEPLDGLDVMLRRRGMAQLAPRLTAGPATLTMALGITVRHNGSGLCSPPLWIEDRGFVFADRDILASPRVGVAYAGPDALRPWRFRVNGSAWTSAAK
ncbi:MAG: DNA-3-methyladenine glycosylase [Verrucomicrobiales bacterium]|jgi:DNA-3-methyladenine glycosylase|nr:DNA-3-methyladenine glycosylase [Verrucomicrobiales bacterium]